MDEAVGAKTKLDAVVTVADAKWLATGSRSAGGEEPDCFRGRHLLNKTDLVTAEELGELEARIRGLNPYARLHRTQRAKIDIMKCSAAMPSISIVFSISSRRF